MPRSRNRWPELCERVATDDGLPVRESGSWTEDKLFDWNRYVEITTTAMVGKPNWQGGVVYVDLFAGPGVCEIRDSKKRIPGSVLIAAFAPKPFAKIIACELDPVKAEACEKRLAAAEVGAKAKVIVGDCNQRIADITNQIPDRALTLAFIDPEALDVNFSTVEALTKNRRVDLMVLFADRMDIVRNVANYAQQKQSKLDTFLGQGSDWRTKWESLPNQNAQNVCNLFTEIYQSQLQNIGYLVFSHKRMRSQTSPLYRMIYASKDERGLDFMQKAQIKDRHGQRDLPF